MERIDRGRNVRTEDELYNDYPVALEVCETYNFTATASGGASDIRNPTEFSRMQDRSNTAAYKDGPPLQQADSKRHETANRKECRPATPLSRFGIYDRSNYATRTRDDRLLPNEELNTYRNERTHSTEDPKTLVHKLVSRCRTLAVDRIHSEQTKFTRRVPATNSSNKQATIWDWSPKRDDTKVDFKLDTTNLEIPSKSINFVRLFKQFCTSSCIDMRVIIDDTVFHCHKIVVQSYSKHFQTQIKSKGFKKDVMIELPNDKVNKNVFMDLYIWMLNSPKNCMNSFTNYNILNLLMAAAYLKVEELEEHCWSYIKDRNNFDESTAFDLYWEARSANYYWPVMELMITRIKSFFLTLIQTDRFLSLSESELHLLLDSNHIAVNTEIQVLFALILWLRKRNMSEPWQCPLFRLIRFSQMSPIQLVELQSMTELHYLIKICPVSEMIQNGLKIAIRREHAKNTQTPFTDPEPEPRNWLPNAIIYKSYNDFVDSLIKKRSHMRKPHCELITRETLEALKIPILQPWTQTVPSSV